MNKKITIYELLGLIKDGKIPKKIKYNGDIYEYKISIEGTGYVHEQFIHRYIWLSNEIASKIDDIHFNCLNDKVEIQEDEKDIEEIEQIITSRGAYTNFDDVYKDMTKIYEKTDEIVIIINEVIREVNKLRKEK